MWQEVLEPNTVGYLKALSANVRTPFLASLPSALPKNSRVYFLTPAFSIMLDF